MQSQLFDKISSHPPLMGFLVPIPFFHTPFVKPSKSVDRSGIVGEPEMILDRNAMLQGNKFISREDRPGRRAPIRKYSYLMRLLK